MLTCYNEDEEFKANEEFNTDVMKNYYRVQTAEKLDEGMQLAENSQYEEAKAMFDVMIKEMQESNIKDDEVVLALIKDLQVAKDNCKP